MAIVNGQGAWKNGYVMEFSGADASYERRKRIKDDHEQVRPTLECASTSKPFASPIVTIPYF